MGSSYFSHSPIRPSSTCLPRSPNLSSPSWTRSTPPSSPNNNKPRPKTTSQTPTMTKKAKELLTGKKSDQEEDLKKALSDLTPEQVKELMALNPALASELTDASGSSNPSPEKAAEALKNLNLQDIMTGLASGGKNVKEMGAYKFWQTQPVPKFGDDDKSFEGTDQGPKGGGC